MRYAFRKLRRDPGFTLAAGLSLTLGVGLTTIMFSVTYGAFFRGLPFDEADELVHVERVNRARGSQEVGVTVHDYLAWRDGQHAFEGLAAYDSRRVNLSGTDRPERVSLAAVTPNAFALLGTGPALGRAFGEEETRPGAEPVAIIGNDLWRNRFGSDPDVVGRVIRVDGTPVTVVGVMPPGFGFPLNQAMWVPLTLDPASIPRHAYGALDVLGRLRDGMAMETALQDLEAISRALAAEYPATNADVVPVIRPFDEQYFGAADLSAALTMLGAVVLVLLIACANVANLILARAISRSREVGVRTALGARRAWIVGHFLVEALAITVVGAVAGLGVAALGVDWLNGVIVDKGPPFWVDIRIDGVSLLFATAAVLVATLLSGALPAWQAARANVVDILKDGSRGASSFRLGRISRALVIGEVALSSSLMILAGLGARSVVELNTVEKPYRTEDIFAGRVSLPYARYQDDDARATVQRELALRLPTLPGVRAAGLASAVPGFWAGQYPFAMDGETYPTAADYPRTQRIAATPGMFDALGVGAVSGRLFRDTDRQGSLPVAVVNRAFAQRFGDGADIIGQRIRTGPADGDEPWRTVVGVVPDMHASGLRNRVAQQAVYVPLAQDPGTQSFELVAWTAGPPADIAPAARALVADIDGDLALYAPASLEQRIEQAYWMTGLFSQLFGGFGLAALLLATIGLYGVMSFNTRSRTREIGIRMALGADGTRVLRMVLRRGSIQLATGLGLGLAIAALGASLITDFLFGTDPRDPVTFLTVLAILAGVGIGAVLIPARRATLVDPIEALREE